MIPHRKPQGEWAGILAQSNRPAKPQPELDEVADGYAAVEVEDVVDAAEGEAELDEVAGGHGAIAVGVAEEAEVIRRGQGLPINW